jgi:hypothetical protein
MVDMIRTGKKSRRETIEKEKSITFGKMKEPLVLNADLQ